MQGINQKGRNQTCTVRLETITEFNLEGVGRQVAVMIGLVAVWIFEVAVKGLSRYQFFKVAVRGFEVALKDFLVASSNI